MSSPVPDRHSPSTPEVDAARILLSRLGLTAEDLLDAPVPRPTSPTFRDYIPIVAAGVRPGTRRVYSSCWKRIEKHWGERRIDEPRGHVPKHTSGPRPPKSASSPSRCNPNWSSAAADAAATAPPNT
jgi:hypothetical protein